MPHRNGYAVECVAHFTESNALPEGAHRTKIEYRMTVVIAEKCGGGTSEVSSPPTRDRAVEGPQLVWATVKAVAGQRAQLAMSDRANSTMELVQFAVGHPDSRKYVCIKYVIVVGIGQHVCFECELCCEVHCMN